MEVHMQVEDAIAVIDDVLQGSPCYSIQPMRYSASKQSRSTTVGTQMERRCTATGVQTATSVRQAACQCCPLTMTAACQTDDDNMMPQLNELRHTVQQFDEMQSDTLAHVTGILEVIERRVASVTARVQHVLPTLHRHTQHACVGACIVLLIEEESRARNVMQSLQQLHREMIHDLFIATISTLTTAQYVSMNPIECGVSQDRCGVDATLVALYEDICETLLT